MVIEAEDWEKKGLLVLKLEKEKDWAEAGVGGEEMDAGDYEAERASFKDNAIVNAHVWWQIMIG